MYKYTSGCPWVCFTFLWDEPAPLQLRQFYARKKAALQVTTVPLSVGISPSHATRPFVVYEFFPKLCIPGRGVGLILGCWLDLGVGWMLILFRILGCMLDLSRRTFFGILLLLVQFLGGLLIGRVTFPIICIFYGVLVLGTLRERLW